MALCVYDDSTLISPENLSYYANTNEAHLTLPVRGIVLELPGLGGSSCLGGCIDRGDYAAPHALDFASKGILLCYLFPGPWSWGNRGAVRMGDAVVRALAKKYQLGDCFPFAVCGGSMGGMGALLFAADSSLPLRAVASACPGVDSVDRFECHPDFPRTYISAVACYDLPLDEALKRISPMHRIADMPDLPYFICSDGADELFPEAQCDAYVDAMRASGKDVIYRKQPALAHGFFLPEVREELHAFLREKLLEI